MYTALNTNQIVNELMTFNVFEDNDESFSYECCKALAEYLEEYEESTGLHLELDPIALRCEWSCYTISEIEENWCIDTSDAESFTEVRAIVLEFLQENTEFIKVNVDRMVNDSGYYLVQEF